MKFFYIPYSPWSIQAKWVLDHHQIAYKPIEFVPMISNAQLRLASGQWFGKITAPTLIDGSQVWADSYDIARHADAIGSHDTLFPEGQTNAIHDWNERTHEIKDLSRRWVTAATMQSPDALAASLPPLVPRPARKPLRHVATVGCHYIARKYEFDAAEAERTMDQLRSALTYLRDNLDKDYLLGQFSYADVVAASSFNLFAPVDNKHIRLLDPIRNAWTREDLIEEFSDLIEWRDSIFEKHYKVRA